MRKFILAAIAATTLGLGVVSETAPSQAQGLFFGFGSPGYHGYNNGYYNNGYGYGNGYGFRDGYGDGYGYPRYRYRHAYNNCRIVVVRRHHHWVQVRRCY